MKKIFYTSIIIATLVSCSKSKNELISGSWTVKEMDLSGTKISGDAFNIDYNFTEDGNFTRTESGKKQEGTYQISTEGDSLFLTYTAQNTSQGRKIQDLTSDSLITTWEEFGMKYTEVARSSKD